MGAGGRSLGAVGRIVPHEDGFRAQYAKVLAIFEDPYETPKQQILESYTSALAIISPDHYDAFCLEHKLIRLDWQSG